MGYENYLPAPLVYVLVILSAIVLVGNALNKIREWFTPGREMKETLEAHSQLLQKDKKRLDQQSDDLQMLLSCMLVTMNHEITGNSVDKLKEKRDELQDYLTGR